MIEVITKYLPLIVFMAAVLALIVLFIRTDGLEQRLTEANERHIRTIGKINDPIKEHGRRLCGVSDTLGHLIDRLGRLEDLAIPAAAELGAILSPISAPTADSSPTDEELIKVLDALQKEFKRRGGRLSYELVSPAK